MGIHYHQLSQKGAITVQSCSIENQKGAITRDIQQITNSSFWAKCFHFNTTCHTSSFILKNVKFKELNADPFPTTVSQMWIVQVQWAHKLVYALGPRQWLKILIVCLPVWTWSSSLHSVIQCMGRRMGIRNKPLCRRGQISLSTCWVKFHSDGDNCQQMVRK